MMISSGIFGTTVIDDPPEWRSGPDVAALDAQYAAELERCRTTDKEDSHIEADKLLCELLSRMGFVQAVAAFESLDKWYA